MYTATITNDELGNLQRLTTNSATDRFPSCSPDGTTLVFESSRNNSRYGIYSVNADDSGTVTTVTNSENSSDRYPHWSPVE